MREKRGEGRAGVEERETKTRAPLVPRTSFSSAPRFISPPFPSLFSPGHCVDIDRDECVAISVDQYDLDVAALVAKRDRGEIPAGELRLLPPLPAPAAQATEEVKAEEPAPAAP